MKKAVLAVAVASSLIAGVAFARGLITTQAGCNSEFGHGHEKDACVACVKSGGKFVMHAGKKVWVCEK